MALAHHIAAAPGTPDRWGDPCVGAGRLLVAGWDVLVAHHAPARLRAAAFGWDTDPQAVEAASCALTLCVVGSVEDELRRGRATEARSVAQAELHSEAIECADGLERLGGLRGRVRIVTNPPFASARTMRRVLGAARVRALRERFDACHGAFDLGVPFVQACLAATREGAFAAVVPATWASAAYASRLRDLMAAQGGWQLLEPDHRRFAAGVATVAVGRTPGPPADPWRWSRTLIPAGCVRLDSVADVVGGLPGFEARAASEALVEASEEAVGWPFVTTARVRPWRLRDAPVRAMGRTLEQPVLPRNAAPAVRAARYDAGGLLVPTVFRQLHACWDRDGVATGVGVVRVAASPEMQPMLAAVLNHPTADALLAAAFPGADLSGGYRRATTAALRALPIPSPARADVRAERDVVARLSEAAWVGDADALSALEDIVARWYGDALALVDAEPHGCGPRATSECT